MKNPVLIGGTWTIGEWHWGKVNEKDAIETAEIFVEKYGFIDTAPIYGFGKSEKIIGSILKTFPRKKVKLMTKFGLNKIDGEFFFQTTYKGKSIKVYKKANRASIREECEKSLKRLNTDYIDIYFLHFKPETSNLTEIASTLEELKREGKIKQWGVCNLNTGDLHLLVSKGFTPYCLQFKYNPLFTKPEKSVIPYCKKYGIRFFAYSPFEQGLLTGKYIENNFHSEDGRRYWKKERLVKAVCLREQLSLIAKKYNLTIPQLILCYLKTKPLDGIIAGARTKIQAEENIEKFNTELNEEDIRSLRTIFNNFKVKL